MAIAKVIYKSSAEATPEVWIDTTQKTVTAGSMLSGTTALKNDGTDITGNITSKTSSDLTASGLTVTVPAGHYASNAAKTLTDANLTAGNIKKDVSIFGITGSYEGGDGSSIDMEQGEITLSESQTGLVIPFTNTHSTPPVFFLIAKQTEGIVFSNYSAGVHILTGALFTDALDISTIESKSSAPYYYEGIVSRVSKSSISSTSMTNTLLTCTTNGATQWSTYVTSSGFSTPTSEQYGIGTYKWIAIWNSWE